MNGILDILEWAIPSGGVGAAIAWLANRKAMQAKNTRAVHDTYKAMYEDISRELLNTQEKLTEISTKTDELTAENSRTRRALNRLSRAIEAIQICPHRADCPVNAELRLTEDDNDGEREARPKRQRRRGGGDRGDKDGAKDGHGGDAAEDGDGGSVGGG